MQVAIELPEELSLELLKHEDVQGFIVQAIQKLLLEEKQSTDLLINIVKDLPEIACFKGKNPIDIQSALRDEWD